MIIFMPLVGFYSDNVLISMMIDMLNCIVSSFVAFTLVHYVITEKHPFYLSKGKMVANLICNMIVLFFLYLVFANMNISCVIGVFFLVALGNANYFVYHYRGTELSAADFMAIRTAANVAKQYQIRITSHMLYVWGSFLLFAIIEIYFQFSFERGLWQKRLFAVIAFLCSNLCFFIGTKSVRGSHWQNEGSQNYGFFLNFMVGAKELLHLKPRGYSCSKVEKVANKYCDLDTERKCPSEECLPDIIVIMNESFSNLNVLGNKLSTNVPATPFFDSIKKNTVKGFALSSVFGGGTADSEYEFLTGNSMAFFPNGSVPFQQFVKGNTYSVVTELKKMGYRCVATHPYLGSGYSRPTAYPAFGFDEMQFIDDYPKEKYVRWYISDQEMYDHIIKQYEEKPENQSLFIYGVTIQNHGGYVNRGRQIENTVRLNECTGKYFDVEQYLSLLRLSDDALKTLISYFESVERKVIICFFGDHLPGVNPDFLKEMHGGDFKDLTEKQRTKMVPFIIWSNQELMEREITCTSLNYLAMHVFEALGIKKLPSYFKYLKDLETIVPAINVDGYYSIEDNKYLSFDKLQGIVKEALSDYRMLVYNSAVDHKNRNKKLFPEWGNEKL